MGPPPRPRWSWLLIAVAVIAAFAVARGAQRTPPPAIKVDCAHPALALSGRSVTERTTVQWSASGAAGEHVVLAVGGDRLEPAPGGQLRVVPPPGKTSHDVQAASHGEQLSGCKASGWFAVQVPPGDYVVRMFRVQGSGAAMTATPIASVPLTVLPR